MTMKPAKWLIACFVALLALAFVAGLAAADVQTVTVNPNANQSVNLGTMTEGDLLSLSWTSNTAVSAVLTGPAAYSKTYSSSSLGFDLLTIPHDGAYTLTFTNPSSSTTATVELTFDVSPFNPVHEATSFLTWILIIAAIIIVVIVVIVVLVLVMGRKNKQPAGTQPGIVTPTTPGMCPVCGSQTDTNAPFCAKCGAKFR